MTHFCEYCEYTTDTLFNLQRHQKTRKHFQNMMQNDYSFFNVARCSQEKPQTAQNRGEKAAHKNEKVCAPTRIFKTQKNKKELDVKISDTESTLKCKYCDMTFAHRTSLYKHEKFRCSYNVSKEINSENEKLKQQLEQMTNNYIAQLQKENEQLHKIIETSQETHKVSTTTLDKSVDALTYLTQNRKKAPVLQQLTQEKAKEMLLYEKRLYDYLLYHNDEGTLDHYIGDIILKYIKKDDPDYQSVWSTDLARLTYLVRNLVEDEQVWQRDAKAVMFTKCVIMPIINYLKTYLCNCLANKDDSDDDSESDNDSDNDTDNKTDDTAKDTDSDKTRSGEKRDNSMYRTRDIIGTMQTIRSKKFKNDLLTYIGSHVPLQKIESKKKNKN